LGKRRRAAHRGLGELAQRLAGRGIGPVNIAHHRLRRQRSQLRHDLPQSTRRFATVSAISLGGGARPLAPAVPQREREGEQLS
jgi:hypothetical protein